MSGPGLARSACHHGAITNHVKDNLCSSIPSNCATFSSPTAS